VDPAAIPADPLGFIKECVEAKRVFWTYHVNLRMWQRRIPSGAVLAAWSSYEVVEEYPADKHLPSYLVRAKYGNMVFHVLFATDVAGDNVRIVTVYVPDPGKWDHDLRIRRQP
jgi:hypothetical protein